MSENNEHLEEHERYENFHYKHPWCSTLIIALSVLIGSFLAFYVVVDWHFKRMFDPAVQMKRMEHLMKKEDRAFQNFMKHDFNKAEREMNGFIQLDENEDEYIVSVNLRSFNNDENNISISAEDNILTVHATNEKNKKNNSKVLEVSQSYLFPSRVDFSKITKKRLGDRYLIIVPKK